MHILAPTAEEIKQHSIPMLADYTQTYTDMYLTLTMGFFIRTGETPDIVREIADVWARGIAELSEHEPRDEGLMQHVIACYEEATQ